jgi:hypothetical protein
MPGPRGASARKPTCPAGRYRPISTFFDVRRARSVAAAFEIAATKVAVGLNGDDCGLDGAAAPQIAFDAVEHAALLAGDGDAARAAESDLKK